MDLPFETAHIVQASYYSTYDRVQQANEHHWTCTVMLQSRSRSDSLY